MTHYGYPPSALALVRDRKYKKGVITAMKAFKKNRFYASKNKASLLKTLHTQLCSIYDKKVSLNCIFDEDFSSGGSLYKDERKEIVLSGRPSIITYLHEFAHALGHDEYGAVDWSINLYRRIYPKNFAKLKECGHMLISGKHIV